jgi:hypothetical protein
MNLLSKTTHSLLLIAGIFVCSCGDGTAEGSDNSVDQSTKEKNYTTARLVQTDSIFSIYDYQPESELFLAGDIRSFMVVIGSSPPSNELGHMVINRSGEIIHQFNRTDNGPEGHGAGAMDNFFMSPESIGVFAAKGLYQYKLDGTFVNQYKEINALDKLAISSHRVGFSADGRHVSMGLAKGMKAAKKFWDSLYQIGKPLWFYDLDRLTTDTTALIGSDGYPDHEIYATGSKFPHSTFPPRMAIDHAKNRLLSVYPEIPELTVYDMETGQAIETYNLEPEHFEFETEEGEFSGGIGGYEGLAWMNRGGRMANSNYHDVFQMGEYTLLRYSAALPADAVNQLIATGGPGKSPDWPRLRRKYYRHYYQLLKNGQKVLPDFELPELEPQQGQLEFNNHRRTRGKIIGGNGLDEIFIFIPNDGEEERDYELIRVFKLELLGQ